MAGCTATNWPPCRLVRPDEAAHGSFTQGNWLPLDFQEPLGCLQNQNRQFSEVESWLTSAASKRHVPADWVCAVC